MMPTVGQIASSTRNQDKPLYLRYIYVGIYLGIFTWGTFSYYIYMDAFAAMLLLMLSPVLAAPFAAYLLYALVLHAVKLRWLRCLNVVLGGVIMVGVFALLDFGWHNQLTVLKPLYTSRLPASDHNQPRFAAWPWQDTTGPLQSWTYTLVYDESDEITLELGARSLSWRVRANQASAALNRPWRHFFSLSSQQRVTVENKGDHFYMVVEHDG